MTTSLAEREMNSPRSGFDEFRATLSFMKPRSRQYSSDILVFEISVTEGIKITHKESHDQAVVTDFEDRLGTRSEFEDRTKLEAEKFFLETQLKLARYLKYCFFFFVYYFVLKAV